MLNKKITFENLIFFFALFKNSHFIPIIRQNDFLRSKKANFTKHQILRNVENVINN